MNGEPRPRSGRGPGRLHEVDEAQDDDRNGEDEDRSVGTPQTGASSRNSAAGPNARNGKPGTSSSHTRAAAVNSSSNSESARDSRFWLRHPRQAARIPASRQLEARLRQVEPGEPQRRPGEDHQGATGVSEHGLHRALSPLAGQERGDEPDHHGHDHRREQAHLEGEQVDREDHRADQLLVGAYLPATTIGWPCRRSMSASSSSRSGPIQSRLRSSIWDEVLGELTDDVVLLPPREEEPHRLKVSFEQFHWMSPKGCRSGSASMAATRRAAAPASARRVGDRR